MKSKVSRNLLIALLAFLGLGAIGGGAVLIISPSGKLMGMPLAMLDTSPFSNFLIPGIILFLVLGLLPMFLLIALLKNPHQNLQSILTFAQLCTGFGHAPYKLPLSLFFGYI